MTAYLTLGLCLFADDDYEEVATKVTGSLDRWGCWDASWSQHVDERHAPATGQLLRYREGTVITGRRYDGLWDRIGQVLPWVTVQGITAHWIRHTTLTWVERNFGYAVARAYAGHNDSNHNAGTTTTYVRATIHEVAAALAALTGEPHPLAGGDL